MLTETDADAVYLGIPNFLHADMGKQALSAGHHVIVEKPMTSNLWEAENLADLARKSIFSFMKPLPRFISRIMPH